MAEAIDHSMLPGAITPCLPQALKDVSRNKSDGLFKRYADKGGVSLFAPGLAASNDATMADVVDAIAYMIKLVGEDHVAIGTDFSLNRPRPGPSQDWGPGTRGARLVDHVPAVPGGDGRAEGSLAAADHSLDRHKPSDDARGGSARPINCSG